MNSLLKTLAFCAALGASGSAQAITVGVDSNQIWNGYMNVFNLPANGGAYQFGSNWGTADLVAVFNGGSLTLSPNTIGDPNSYWYTPSGGPGATGNKIMEANFYVQVPDGQVSGQTLTFQGTVTANTFTSGHTTKAFIKEFEANYSSSTVSEVVLTPGPFSISLPISSDPAKHVQYGFQTVGACVWVTDVGPFGSVVIQDAPAPFVPDQIPNGNFEIANGANWGTTQGTPTYPTTGGNPDGNAVLTSPGGFAVLYAFNNAEKSFASLGLSPGDTYTFQMDMKVISGSIGGIRLEGPAGYVIDQFAPANTGGSGWATYSFELTVPNSPAQAKFGLRTPDGSSVAFDNVMILLPPPPGAPQVTIATGNLVNWTAPSAVNTYQVQGSQDGSIWTAVGPLFTGNSVTSLFDPSNAAFYQVLETTPPTLANGVLNPGFETSDITSTPADNWNTLNQLNGGSVAVAGTFSTFTPNGGSKMLVMEVQTPSVSPAPAIAEVRSTPIAITGGGNYNFSFHAANVVKTGGSNPQFSYFFFDSSSQVINPPVFTSYASVGSAWTLVQNNFTAPAGATSMTVGFFMPTGAEPDVNWVTLVDDVSLPTPSIPGDISVLDPGPTATPSVEISWPTVTGRTYQAKSSTNLVNWADFGGSISGNGQVWSITDTMTPPSKFYRILQTSP